jgi:hypothetical protein
VCARAVSVPFVVFFYKLVFGIRYLGVLNGISLFLILGIGVDDSFIFYNTFLQHADVDDIATRVSVTYRRATKATFITSATTAAAFATSLASEIPVRVAWCQTHLIACANRRCDCLRSSCRYWLRLTGFSSCSGFRQCS